MPFVLSRNLGDGDICCISKLGKDTRYFPSISSDTATVERSFSNIQLIKTRLQSRMSEDTLDYSLRLCIEGPDYISDENLDEILDHYEGMKFEESICEPCYVLLVIETFLIMNLI